MKTSLLIKISAVVLLLGFQIFLIIFLLTRNLPNENIETFVDSKNNFPITIQADNYTDDLKNLGPFIIYGWAADPAISGYDRQVNSLRKQGPFSSKMIIFSSYKTMEQKLSEPGHVDELKSIGVEWMGFNTEGDKTPSDEFNSMTSNVASQNSVCRFAQISEQYGFKSLWGAIRGTAGRAVSEKTLIQMLSNCGLDGIAFQEQKFIENACATDRFTATQTDKRNLDANTGKNMYLSVQLMESRCLQLSQCNNTSKYQNCMNFTKQLIENKVANDIAIWINPGVAVIRGSNSNTETFLNFVKELRQLSVGSNNPTPTPTTATPIPTVTPTPWPSMSEPYISSWPTNTVTPTRSATPTIYMTPTTTPAITPTPTPVNNGCSYGSSYSFVDLNNDNRVNIDDFICFVKEYQRRRN